MKQRWRGKRIVATTIGAALGPHSTSYHILCSLHCVCDCDCGRGSGWGSGRGSGWFYCSLDAFVKCRVCPARRVQCPLRARAGRTSTLSVQFMTRRLRNRNALTCISPMSPMSPISSISHSSLAALERWQSAVHLAGWADLAAPWMSLLWPRHKMLPANCTAIHTNRMFVYTLSNIAAALSWLCSPNNLIK